MCHVTTILFIKHFGYDYLCPYLKENSAIFPILGDTQIIKLFT